MRVKATALVIGAVFGATLSWTGMTSPNVIRDALLFKSAYLFLFFGSAVATAFVGLRLLRARRTRAVLTNRPIAWSVDRPRRRHIVGSVIFGLGWGVADACPGPIATQLGQGIWWSLFTIAGITVGITLYLRRQPTPAVEPDRGYRTVTAASASAATFTEPQPEVMS
jgi:uncharacterized membrane protein YedE/YeeE